MSKNLLQKVPDVNAGEYYPLESIPDSFLMMFPEQAKEKIKAGMESCYIMTSRKYLLMTDL